MTNHDRKLVYLLVSLLVISAFPTALTLHQAAGDVTAPGFEVLSVTWGTPAQHESPGPGSQDVTLTVTLEYVYQQQTGTINANLTLPSGFTDNEGDTVATSYVSGETSPGSTVQLTFYLSIGSNVSLGDRTVPLSLVWLTGDSQSGLTTNDQQTSVSLPLEGAVSLKITTSQTTLVPGELNNISLSVQDTGSGLARDLSTSVSSSSPSAVVSQPASISEVGAGSTVVRIVSIFVPSTAAGSPVVLTLSSSYLDPYNNTENSSASLTLVASSTQAESDVLLVFESSGVPMAPGVDQVTLMVKNEGATAASQLSTTVTATGGATVLSQPSVITNLVAGASAPVTLSLYVPATLAGSAVALTLDTSYLDLGNGTHTSSASLGLMVGASGEPQLEVSDPGAIQLVPGQANTVTFDVTNVGSVAASSVTPSISLTGQTGSVESVSPSTIASIAPGATAKVNVTLYATPGAAGSVVDLSFSFGYTGTAGIEQSPAQSVGAYVETVAQVFADTSLSVTPLEDSVVSGETSLVSFEVTNTGDSAVYSPEFTLSISQPLVIVGNSTFSAIGKEMAPGQSVVFSANVTASPSASSGIYSGTLSLSFTNQAGVPDSQNYSVAVKLSGLIELVIQSEQFTQSATALTVTGDILNEGTSPADFASVVGSMAGTNSTGQPDYVGEVDVNSPVPFSVTIPYQSSSGSVGNVTLAVQYKDSLGDALNYHYSEAARLQSPGGSSSSPTSGNTGQPSQTGLSILDLALVLVAVFVAVGVGIGVAVRRRGRTAPSTPEDEDAGKVA